MMTVTRYSMWKENFSIVTKMPRLEAALAGSVINSPRLTDPGPPLTIQIRSGSAGNICESRTLSIIWIKKLASFSSTASFKRSVFNPLAPPASSLGSEVGTAADFFSSFSCSGVGRKDFSSVDTGVNRDLEKGFVQLASLHIYKWFL